MKNRQCSAIAEQCSAVQFSAVQSSSGGAVECIAVQFGNCMQCRAVQSRQCSAVQCSAVQCSAGSAVQITQAIMAVL